MSTDMLSKTGLVDCEVADDGKILELYMRRRSFA